ncbi:MAG: iron ABC transporter substrate-binding protein, partial [Alphaproteobacteria bacterium]
ANLARKPQGNDRAQAKAIFSGACDIALGNHYYVGRMITNEKEPEQKDWAAAIKVLFPNAADRGTHVNISGMAMAAHAPNRDNALALMEYLSSGPAQEIYAAQVFEYPVKDGFSPVKLIADFGTLKADTLPIAEIAKHRKAASEMVDRVGFNDGPSS